jgi:Trypsin-like peptidase domain
MNDGGTAASSLSPAVLDGLAKLLTRTLGLGDLERMVYLATGDDLFADYLGAKTDDPLRTMMLKLLKIFEQQGLTERFLTVVYRERPFKADVRAAIVGLFPRVERRGEQAPVDFRLQVGGTAQPLPAGAAPGLQKNISPALRSPDVSLWLDKLEAVRRQVCRVEIPGQALGTGFLVGRTVVLTNGHVVEEARKASAESSMVCRFDYRRLSNGLLDAGVEVPVLNIVDESPCSDAERTATPDVPAPKADELDYALLRVGDIPGAPRGAVAMVGPPVQTDQALIIVQYPKGDPVRFAIDTKAVKGYKHDGLRLRYRTNTDAGSSGSPCFTMDFDLVALHQLGDPGRPPPTFNQGIPIRYIRASIVARGHNALLT